MPATRTTKKPAAKAAAKTSSGRMSFKDTMSALEKAGTAQTRKTYLRHGAQEPLFGVSFATMKTLVKRIGVDHELAHELWATKNHDARVLALKIADPKKFSSGDLDRWAREWQVRSCAGYVAMLAAEGPHAAAKAKEWSASSDEALRSAAWILSGHMAILDERTPDAYFEKRLAHFEKSIHAAPNAEREAMYMAVIQIGGRNAALRKAATAAAKRIGKVEIDYGDTECKTPDAVQYIAKMWAHSESKKFESPAAQERERETMRTRC